MKKLFHFLLLAVIALCGVCGPALGSFAQATDVLKFHPNRKHTDTTLTFLDGRTVKYRAYENIYYVAKCLDFRHREDCQDVIWIAVISNTNFPVRG